MRPQTRLCMARWLAAALLAAALISPARAGEAAAPGGDAPKRAFRFLAIADTHFWEQAKNPASLAAFKDFLEQVKPLGADFLVILGDVCGDQPAALPEAAKIAEESGVKVHFVSGNHDDSDGNQP
jgi:predicted MPP superfamily phosphohydrolase